MATFTCSSRPLVSLLPEMRFSSSPAVSVSSRRVFGGLPESNGLRIRYSSSSASASASFTSRNPRVLRQRRGIVCEAQETALDIPAVTDSTWDSLVLKADGPVLVDFWAPWCGPCRMIDPIVSDLAQQYAGKIKIYKMNTDDSPSIPSQYGVRSIPTIIIFVNGEKRDTIIGAVPKTTLTASIEKLL